MLQFLRCPRSVLKNFLIFLSSFSVISKKKSHCFDGGIFFSDFMLIFKKKKVLRLSSASVLRASCDIQERGLENRSCLLFLVGNKNAGFWQEKKCQNSQKFNAKMLEKIPHFFCTYREHCLQPLSFAYHL